MIGADHNPCAPCGRCCRSYLVPVTGYDLWLISTRQRLDPASFVVASPRAATPADGFRLDAGERRFGLVLDKRGRWTRQAPCIFLLRLAGEHERCGIYAERPVACRTYPMELIRFCGPVAVRRQCLPGQGSRMTQG